MDWRDMPPKTSTVRQIANLLATQYPELKPVGERWTYEFIKRHSDLASKWNRKYDYQHAKCEDPTLIRSCFKRIQNIKIEYEILDEDIWNFDKTGF